MTSSRDMPVKAQNCSSETKDTRLLRADLRISFSNLRLVRSLLPVMSIISFVWSTILLGTVLMYFFLLVIPLQGGQVLLEQFQQPCFACLYKIASPILVISRAGFFVHFQHGFSHGL
jgi:hypothetical protein